MGGREDPALMMDPANCSPVQVAGTCQKNPSQSPPVRMAVVCQHTKTERGTSYRLAAGLGCWSGCSPALLYPAGMWGVGLTSGLETPRGAKVQQPLPDVHASRARHRCSTPAWRGDEWHFDTHRTVLATVGRSLVSEFRTSRMFTMLNVGRRFSRGLSKPDNLLWQEVCLVWFGLFSISGGFFFLFP